MPLYKKFVVPGAIGLAATLGVVGGSLLTTAQSLAADTNTSINSTAQNGNEKPDGPIDHPPHGPFDGRCAKGDELTGDTAEKVKSAALDAVPGATVDHLMTGPDGVAYIAAVRKSDGTRVIVKVNDDFSVQEVEEAHRDRHH